MDKNGSTLFTDIKRKLTIQEMTKFEYIIVPIPDFWESFFVDNRLTLIEKTMPSGKIQSGTVIMGKLFKTKVISLPVDLH